MSRIKHLYIHIPFCSSICAYCAFTKVYYNEELALKYLDSLEEEINKKYKGDTLDTIYIGGGTPSSLSINALKKLKNITDKLNKSKNIEFTFEVNPDVTIDKLNIIKDMGVNRLSIGLETINNKFYKSINRYNDENKFKELIKYFKTLFNNINVDLMYGFNNETLSDLKKDLDYVISLKVNHISIYALMIEEHTKLYIEKYKEESDDKLNKMYYFIDNYLNKNNYIHYETSNFALKGYESIHNNSYWKNEEYYGFGLSASAYINDTRYTNTRSLDNYFNKKYITQYEKLSKYDKMVYEMILGLRLKNGVSLKEFKDKYHKDLLDVFKIDDLINNGYLQIENDRIFIPIKYWFVENSILERFV